MGLVSYLASRPEVLRVGPFYKAELLNSVAKAISQSATITDSPLTEAGLDGSGEVIQVTQISRPVSGWSRVDAWWLYLS